MEILILVSCILGLSWIASIWAKARSYNAMRKKIESLDSDRKSLEDEKRFLELERKKFQDERLQIEVEWNKKIKFETEAVQTLARQKSMGFPWLASAYAEFFALEDKRIQYYLERKKRPAKAAADEVKAAGQRRKEAEFKFRHAKYKIEYYESLFPWLSELVADSEDESEQISSIFNTSEESKEDAASKWLTADEYQNLPAAKKYQVALDRYTSRKKTSWEIGRDYERYIGYLWEQHGYKVSYHGAIEGFDDMGRDLIAEKNGIIEIIQCKYWSKNKTIHEKHIFQLFGTTIEYWLNSNASKEKTIDDFIQNYSARKVVPIFVTSATLSETAKSASNALNIILLENHPYKEYPRIKCNISGRDNEKIYHLPFDQQYDRVVIEPEKNEFYAWTIEEAESHGFRRAFRWRGAN